MISKPLNEFEISEHAILLEGLPRDLPALQLKTLLENVFAKILKQDQIPDQN